MKAAALSARQARFIEEYLVDGNGAKAAIRAGYAPGSAKVAAFRLLTKDNRVREAIQTRQEVEARRLGATRHEVVAALWAAFQQAREQREPATMIRAAAEVAKMLGLYAPARSEVAVDVGHFTGAERMDRLTNAQLEAIIAAGTAAD